MQLAPPIIDAAVHCLEGRTTWLDRIAPPACDRAARQLCSGTASWWLGL
jgi:hypothetical protein